MLEINKLSVRFSAQNTVQAVDDVTLSLQDGDKTVIIGETGSGKSVLLLAMLNLLPKNAIVSGQVLLDKEDILTASKKRLRQIRGGLISYVPQGGGNSMNPLLTAGFQAGEPLIEHCGYSKRTAVKESIRLFDQLNLGNARVLARSYPHTFSGGMRQRVMVAMGMLSGAKILLADEPTKGLDEKHIRLVADMFVHFEREALLCVTHDLSFAQKISRRICVMYASLQVEMGSTEEIMTCPLHPYTQDMLRAMPEKGMNSCSIGFAPPNTGYGAENGCRYLPRCACGFERCRKMPPMIHMGSRSVRCWKYAD
ncbi:MAG: ABC transporter ATP-binding protein [Lachnospiraceae bacterium]